MAKVALNSSQLAEMYRSPDGPVWFIIARTAERVRDKAAQLAPVGKSGKLATSITSEIRNEGGPVGYVGANTKYAIYVHEGTKPHTIRATNKKALAFNWANAPSGLRPSKSGKYVFKSVFHPGTKGKPFLTDALKAIVGTIKK